MQMRDSALLRAALAGQRSLIPGASNKTDNQATAWGSWRSAPLPGSSFSSSSLPDSNRQITGSGSRNHDLLTAFLQLQLWDDFGARNDRANTNIWESYEMMKLINDTILGLTGHTDPSMSSAENSNEVSMPNDFRPEMNVTDARIPFFGESFEAFHVGYRPIHGYLSIIICTFGLISNIINIAVLSQKVMRTPTNAILTALAAVDAVVMAIYVPFSLHQYFLKLILDEEDWRSLGWMLYIFFTNHLMIYLHSISVWLTITLAVFRYIAVMIPSEVQKFCSMQRAIFAIVSSFIVMAVICIPSYLTIQIKEVSVQELREKGYSNITRPVYRIDESELSTNNGNIPRLVSFYAFSVFAKLVPCFVLTYFSIMLVRALVEVEKRKFNLKNANGLHRQPVASVSNGRSSDRNAHRESIADNHTNETSHLLTVPSATQRTSAAPVHTNNTHQASKMCVASAGRDRTTRMLLVILVSFLITEFPSGLLALFSCFSSDFYLFVYIPLGDLMDILALMNSSVNFIIYCSMSRMFRKTFSHMFMSKSMRDSWKSWKAKRSGPLGGSSSTIPMTERTITYYPGTKS